MYVFIAAIDSEPTILSASTDMEAMEESVTEIMEGGEVWFFADPSDEAGRLVGEVHEGGAWCLGRWPR